MSAELLYLVGRRESTNVYDRLFAVIFFEFGKTVRKDTVFADIGKGTLQFLNTIKSRFLYIFVFGERNRELLNLVFYRIGLNFKFFR